jgi:hypothetical protein
MPKEYQELIYEILRRAFDDYAELKKENVTQKSMKDGGKYSLREIRKFLRSEWCQMLLKGIDAKITGEELIEALQMQYT